jgi:hypothetical protein
MAEQPQTTKIALVVVLAVTLAVVLLVRSGIVPTGSGKPGPKAPPSKTTAATNSTPRSGEGKPKSPTGWSRPDPVGPISRDPTRIDMSRVVVSPNVTSGAAPVAMSGDPEYTVAGITYSTDLPSSVIINGHVLHEGDTIYDTRVVKIGEGSAELSRGGKSWVVRPGEQYRGSEVVRSQN